MFLVVFIYVFTEVIGFQESFLREKFLFEFNVRFLDCFFSFGSSASNEMEMNKT